MASLSLSGSRQQWELPPFLSSLGRLCSLELKFVTVGPLPPATQAVWASCLRSLHLVGVDAAEASQWAPTFWDCIPQLISLQCLDLWLRPDAALPAAVLGSSSLTGLCLAKDEEGLLLLRVSTGAPQPATAQAGCQPGPLPCVPGSPPHSAGEPQLWRRRQGLLPW